MAAVPRTVAVPDVDIWGLVFEEEQRRVPDDHPQYISGETGRQYTLGGTRATAIAFGQALQRRWAWAKGDVLAIASPNCIDFAPVIWGAHWAGGVVSPANPAYTAEELAFQLKDCGAKAIAAHPRCLDVVVAAAGKVGIGRERIVVIGDEQSPREGFVMLEEFLRGEVDAGRERVRVALKTDLAFLVYSSGTTGLPKGVMLSHANVVADVCMMNAVEGPNLESGRDSMLAVLPFYHIYGLTVLIHCCTVLRLKTVVMGAFQLERFCQLIQDHRITYAYLAPPIILHLAKHPVVNNYDLSSLRMITSGAAPLTKELIHAVYERLKVPTKQAYGLSETSPVSHDQPWGPAWHTHTGSVGPALPNLEVKVISVDDRRDLPRGSTGELCMRGPNVFLGYLNNPAATAAALTPDGFFATGDVGHEDPAGNWYITDRIKELIKYKGFQVAPAELEGVLLAHPRVKDAAVVGVYDDVAATEVPRAYVVVEGGAGDETLAREIATWMEGKVAPHKRLRGGVEFLDAIPKSGAGKILRRVLRERAKAGPRAKL